MKITLAVILILIVWFWIDFLLGRKRHVEHTELRIYPKRKGNLALFVDGPSLFSDLFSDIEHATHHIHILFYIVKNDQISQDFFALLEKKASQGVEVRLILDSIGSLTLKRKYRKKLKKSGVMLHFCQMPRFPYLFYSSNVRNHRKLTVIDGRIAYIGGYNIGKEYINQDPTLSPWRDYHMKIVGEAVKDFQDEFFVDWRGCTKEVLSSHQEYYHSSNEGQSLLQLVPTSGVHLEKLLIDLIRNSNERIVIGTPYFIPGKMLLTELQNALRRGVKLEIIVPDLSDHPFVKEAAYPYFRKLLPLGARVYQYQNGFYHSKVLMIDGTIADLGTANFDKRSLYLNYEINCLLFSAPFLGLIDDRLTEDLANSIPLSLDELTSFAPVRMIKESIGTALSLFL